MDSAINVARCILDGRVAEALAENVLKANEYSLFQLLFCESGEESSN